MSVLFVFDDSVEPDRIGALEQAGDVALLPLSGDWRLIRRVEDRFRAGGARTVRLLNAARMVDEQVERLCRDLPAWSARCGNLTFDGKSLKEWLLLPDGGMSAFWLGPISEKNPLKTDSFLLLAQACAVDRELRAGSYKACFAALESRLLLRGIGDSASSLGVRFAPLGKGSRLPGLLQRLRRGRGFIHAAAGLGQILFRAVVSRLLMGRKRARLAAADSMLFVTYFPYLDEEKAARGEFSNKYVLPLQEMMRKRECPMAWLLLFVYVENRSFLNAVLLARRLAKGGERLLFLEEFLGLREVLTLLVRWLAHSILYFRLVSRVGQVACLDLPAPVCAPIVRHLLRRSFCGLEAVRGLFFYLAFKRAFGLNAASNFCLYPCEMQSWEMALNGAARAALPRMRTMAYQHTSVSRNYVFYRNAPSEMAAGDGPAGLPLPETLLCSGRIPFRLLTEWGHSNLGVVEALRQLPLRALLEKDPAPRSGRPVLLVAGSIERVETKALLSMVEEARPALAQWGIVLKGHPSMPLKPILQELGVDAEEVGYELAGGDISSHLTAAQVVIVPTSSVAVEALAYGCEVCVPVFPSVFGMSPLSGYDQFCRKVHTPEELAAALEEYLRSGPKTTWQEKRKFVSEYWCLDPDLSRWRMLLDENWAQRAVANN